MHLRILLLFLTISSYHLFASTEAKLLFKSSFEASYLKKPERQDSPIWWQEILSTQKESFAWPIQLQGEKGSFQMIVNHENINHYMENRIVTTKNNHNQSTQALLQHIKLKEHPWTQSPYTIYTQDKEQKKLYIHYSLKYPQELAKILGKNSWLTFSQFKTKSDYRLAYYIYSDNNQKLYWYVHGDNVVLDGVPYKQYWYQENKQVAVPTGKWFDVEIFWNRSRNKDGHVWLAIDGETVIDYRGPTKLKETIHEIMIFTNYAAVPLKQWIDNIEIWSDFPCGEAQSCHNHIEKGTP
jgi:hypothetical protein